MKIWLDDQYHERKGWFDKDWVYCAWPKEVIWYLENRTVTEISLDHDLGDEHDARNEDRKEVTGYDVMLWIEEQVLTNGFQPPIIKFHSKNSVGQDRMRRSLQTITSFLEKQHA